MKVLVEEPLLDISQQTSKNAVPQHLPPLKLGVLKDFKYSVSSSLGLPLCLAVRPLLDEGLSTALSLIIYMRDGCTDLIS
mmetsp:Transcript_11709/g.22705  ORF Transcript_11709/g.22705 Transcript_11709/m.22705 type:complete len:80 (-) Transcript_11709:31-270(-)